MLSISVVLHVEGLKVNLISTSQLCDQDLFVKFTKQTCEAFDKENRCVLTGSRSSDHYYMLQHPCTSYTMSLDDPDIWYQKLGHFKLSFGLVFEYGYSNKNIQIFFK